jgi:hypothetical protein
MSENWEKGDPCPGCGENLTSVAATIKSHGQLYLDSEGTVYDWEEVHAGETLVMECPECEEELLNKLN